MHACAQVPIWKKEIYEGCGGEWKENKESAAPTVAQLAASATRQRNMRIIAATVAGGALALMAMARLRR